MVLALALGNLFECAIDLLAELLPGGNHVVGAARNAADTQHGVSLADQLAGDRMEDFVEDGVADLLRAGLLEERQREPFAHYR